MKMRAGWRLFGFVAITLFVPAVIGHWSLAKRKFDTSPREKLAQEKPGCGTTRRFHAGNAHRRGSSPENCRG